ncbi:oxysterol-binding protein-related protein 9 isoform X2 [Procambarus clarkii]|uniref:oxysterol-binding protein-related protein 9 isoform X2 n=1 Tax=Procambarus clarkii TaxID=6728 RepID=UPI001E67790C|nr:oxysterol-binding protein-related protein 9-like isoform X2 [Procambarus clarkii]
MAVMEGPLSKWTNVMKGWQYRWFVLDDSAGLLSYYTSKEKMVRGARRGCVRLKGAVVGIDDDDDSTFTITVDAKTFHFQAHDPDEREKWIRGLEDTIVRHTPSIRRWDPSKPAPTMADFDKKLIESDVYLQLLIEQTSVLERHMLATDDEADRQRCQEVVSSVNNVLESIKHAIVLLQIAKNTAFPVNGVYHPCNAIPEGTSSSASSIGGNVGGGEGVCDGGGGGGLGVMTSSAEDEGVPLTVSPTVRTGIEVGRECAEAANALVGMRQRSPVPCQLVPPDSVVPETSYSSSEDEDFFDADDFTGTTPSQSPSGPRLFEVGVETIAGGSGTSDVAPSSASNDPASQVPLLNLPASSTSSDPSSGGTPSIGATQSPSILAHSSTIRKASESGALAQSNDSSEPSIDYDLMYEEDDDPELGSMEGHGSIIHHLLSQVKIGMDLTKVVLPTFILEKRSLLEMYADFFAHPDLFCSIADMTTPQDRMIQVVKWYVSAFHAGRKSEVARKPYNPILGEVFRCYWDIPGVDTKGVDVPDGPIPWAKSNQLCFVAEQVSHHPPISAFYAEHKAKKISFCGHIWTKSKFLGLSICVNNIGQGCVSLMDHDEEYILNFPSGYGRSILTVPWVELGGTCQITCNKTGYNANIEFLTKPFYGGKKHKIYAEVLSPGEKKPVLTVEGEWNGVMSSKLRDGESNIFVDTQSMGTVKKNVKSIAQQAANESRFMWKDVTAGLRFNQIDQATAAKCSLEQKQRDEAKYRKDNGIEWQTNLFDLVGDNWIYKKPLLKRLNQKND